MVRRADLAGLGIDVRRAGIRRPSKTRTSAGRANRAVRRSRAASGRRRARLAASRSPTSRIASPCAAPLSSRRRATVASSRSFCDRRLRSRPPRRPARPGLRAEALRAFRSARRNRGARVPRRPDSAARRYATPSLAACSAKNLNRRAGERFGDVDQLEAETQVRLVVAVLGERFARASGAESGVRSRLRALCARRRRCTLPSPRSRPSSSTNDISTSSWVNSGCRSARESSSRKQRAICM